MLYLNYYSQVLGKLVDDGPISNFGASNIFGAMIYDSVEEQIVPDDWKLTSGASILKQLKVQQKSKPKEKSITYQLISQIDAPMATNVEYHFVSIQVMMTKMMLCHSMVSGPKWIKRL